MFDLDAGLHHKSHLGEFWLSSDSILHTYTRCGFGLHTLNVSR